MITTLDITNSKVTYTIIANTDSPSIPVPGDDVSIPNPYSSGSLANTQQLNITNRIFRFDNTVNPPTLLVVLVTADPIT